MVEKGCNKDGVAYRDLFRHYNITEKTNKNMKKNAVKLNESALRQIVAESVKKVLAERIHWDEPFDDEEMSSNVVEKELDEMEKIVNGIKSVLNLENYSQIGVNGLDKEKAISAIKSIERGISILGMAVSGLKIER